MNRTIFTLGAALALSAATPAAGRTDLYLYGVTYFDRELIRIDVTTGQAELVRVLDSRVGRLDALTYSGDSFYAFDDQSGLIWRFGFAEGSEAVVGSAGVSHVEALATNELDGTTWAAASLSGDFSAEAVAEVDLATGAVGSSVDFGSGFNDVYAMDFDEIGDLWAVNLVNDRQIGRWNPRLAQMEDVRPITGADGLASGLAWDQRAGQGFFVSLLPGVNGGSTRLGRIHPTTGVLTNIGETGFETVAGLTWAPVPEPATLVSVGLGLLGLGHRRRRRRG